MSGNPAPSARAFLHSGARRQRGGWKPQNCSSRSAPAAPSPHLPGAFPDRCLHRTFKKLQDAEPARPATGERSPPLPGCCLGYRNPAPSSMRISGGASAQAPPEAWLRFWVYKVLLSSFKPEFSLHRISVSFSLSSHFFLFIFFPKSGVA